MVRGGSGNWGPTFPLVIYRNYLTHNTQEIKGISSTSVRYEFRSGSAVVVFLFFGRPAFGSIEQTILRNLVA
jgi:hypothetical protein